jgi:hypothetical protein
MFEKCKAVGFWDRIFSPWYKQFISYTRSNNDQNNVNNDKEEDSNNNSYHSNENINVRV